jgi:sugar transferase (PEP-CTERM/EpsH1 system associated)
MAVPLHGQRHVMQVVHSLARGGSERLACDLSLGLDPSRVRSSVCALDKDGPLREDLTRAGIPAFVIGRRPGFDWPVILRLHRLFRDNRVDVVQTHHLNQLVYSGLGARLAGAAIVHVEHEYFSLQRRSAKRRLRLLAPLCHRVVAVGEEIRDFLVREVGLRRSKVVVIRNGVDLARYVPQKRGAPEALGLPRDGELIGHVARLEAEKDQESLLRAFRIVLDARPNVYLVIVGDGSQRGDLERTAARLGIGARVRFLGPRAEVAEILPHLKVFVLSSVNEGLPLAVLEAMACGRPVVATAVGEIPRVVEHGITGFTVAPRDPAALAASVRAVLDHPHWAACMGEAARQSIERAFSLTRVVQQYQVLYDSLRTPRVSLRPQESK